MAQKRKPKGNRASKPVQSAPSQPQRRTLMRALTVGAIAAPFVLGGGYLFATAVQTTISEADLTKIGQGLPAVVQIHDPGCALCRRLQKQTRDVLSD